MGARGADSVLASMQEASAADTRGLLVRERVGLLLDAGRLDEASELAKRASADLPQDLHVQLALGRVLAQRDETRAEAEAVLRRVTEKRPKDVEAWTALGEALASMGRADEAVACWDEALRHAPDAWPPTRRRVEQLVATGQRKQALDRLATYLAREGPYSGEAALALAELELGDPDRRAETAELARRAIRFGAGPKALEVLAQVDPEAAARLAPAQAGGAATPAQKASGAGADSPAAAPAGSAGEAETREAPRAEAATS